MGMTEIEKEFEAWWATEPFGFDHPETKKGFLDLLLKQEAKLAEAEKFNQLLKQKLTDRSTLSVKEVAEMSNKLKVAVEALEKIEARPSGVWFDEVARETLEKLKAP